MTGLCASQRSKGGHFLFKDENENHAFYGDLWGENELVRRFIFYMERTIINAKIDYTRRLQRFENHEVLTANEEFSNLAVSDERSLGNSPESFLDSNLSEAINRLPPVQRRILVLCVVHGYTHEEVAKKLGRAQSTVTRQFQKALQYLREAMQDDPA